jgi:hypothetical protein
MRTYQMTNRLKSIAVGSILLIPGLSIAGEDRSSAAQGITMELPQYKTVVNNLRKASVPTRELEGEGYVSVTLAAGRVVAMAFSKDGANLLWSSPQLDNTHAVETAPETLVGGFGGDRLWFSPELDYHWSGAPDWKGFTNYKAPAVTDPGNYQFVDAGEGAVGVHANGVLTAHDPGQTRIGFDVQRTIRMTPPPLPKTDPLMQGIQYVGIEASHSLKIDDAAKVGRMDLWHLLQTPVGSVLIVPLNPKATAAQRQPLSYGLPGGWVAKPEYILWTYDGKAHAKFGLPGIALTGRTAVLRKLEAGQWCLVVRQFPTDSKAIYGDHPYGVSRSDQVFQAWDGYGFGEMEYHSPILDARSGPRELRESDHLWAFGGSAKGIAALAIRLLGVDTADVMKN